MQLFDLTGRTALVTGASRGIGLAIAEGLAAAGARVVLNARTQSALDEAAATLRARGARIEVSRFSVTDASATKAAIDAIERDVGAIDILVNNAGIQRRAPLHEFDDDDWHTLMACNVDSVYFVSKAVAPHMIARGRGKIINVGSVQCELARPGIAPYTASKGAVKNLTKGMCADWARFGLQGERDRTGVLRHANYAAAHRRSRVRRMAAQAHAGGSLGPARRPARRGRIPGIRRFRFRQRSHALRRRRHPGGDLMTAGPASQPLALQLCPFAAYLQDALASRFRVVRWFELDAPAQQAWLAQHAAGVRAVVTGGHLGCSNQLMAALPGLAIVAVNGVGIDRVDLAFARARGVHVANTPGVLTEDVADLAVGLVIALLRQLPAADAHVRAGHWASQGDRPLAHKVSGRRFGIVGMGRIGAAIAARLAAFGPVAYTGPRKKSDVPFEFVADLTSLAAGVDVLILALPANAATRHLIARPVLDALGPRGFLVNVARGAVVDEAALAAALAERRIAGAALDVFEDEPHVPAGLRDSPYVVLTPHLATGTIETRTRMADIVLANLDAALAGQRPPTDQT